jgi:hypothetical protein
MPALEQQIEHFAQRHGWTLEKAREVAATTINIAVDQALAGSQTSFDNLRELEPFAREIFQERLRRGEGAEGVERVVASTGGRLP